MDRLRVTSVLLPAVYYHTANRAGCPKETAGAAIKANLQSHPAHRIALKAKRPAEGTARRNSVI